MAVTSGACGALRLVGGRLNNVGVSQAGKVRRSSSYVRGVTAGKLGHNSSVFNGAIFIYRPFLRCKILGKACHIFVTYICSELPGQNAQETRLSCGQGSGRHVQGRRLIQRCLRLHHRSAKIQVFALFL